MSTKHTEIQLPFSPLQRCFDRFSILDADEEEDEDGRVPFWKLFTAVVRQPAQSAVQLIDILETIACTLRGSSGVAGDYGMLRSFLARPDVDFINNVWPKIVAVGLQMPELFPSGSLRVLRSGDVQLFSRRQIACLVAHQFLCTLDCPPWRDGFNDFSIWYASEQRHPAAAEMYLMAMCTYLESLDDLCDDQLPQDSVSYALVTAGVGLDDESNHHSRLSALQILSVPEYTTDQQELMHQGPHGGVVISANKHVGFGQSATQEEMYVGNCPEACPAVLCAPPLEDDNALVITGAAPMLRISGERRNISWRVLPPEQRCGGRQLLMDALELDEADREGDLPDLKPENIDREITKAMAAFGSWTSGSAKNRIWTGLWGCGAFNGDPVVKVACMWAAASMVNKELVILIDGRNQDLATSLARFAAQVEGSWTVHDLRQLLGRLPRNLKRLETVQWLDGQELSDSG